MAFEDAFNMSFLLNHDFEPILIITVPPRMMRDSFFLFAMLTRSSSTTENKLMIAPKTMKNSYQSFEVNNVALIPSEFIIADELTIINGNSVLMDALETSKTIHAIKQWMLWPKINEVSFEKKGGMLM